MMERWEGRLCPELGNLFCYDTARHSGGEYRYGYSAGMLSCFDGEYDKQVHIVNIVNSTDWSKLSNLRQTTVACAVALLSTLRYRAMIPYRYILFS